MSKPKLNFWRLKNKQTKTPKNTSSSQLVQKTLSSFFKPTEASEISSNLSQEDKSADYLGPTSSKRARKDPNNDLPKINPTTKVVDSASTSNPPKVAKKKKIEMVTGIVKYTPLEQQVIDLREKYPGVLLFIECGYKYRFFGEDAEIAARELNIYAHMDHNFMTASIPVHRLHAHINRLVRKGHKVGVVKQRETAALKAVSSNKSAPFTRELDQLYTCATLIGEDLETNAMQEIDLDESVPASHILCINEVTEHPKKTSIGFVAVNPQTGDCIYDFFDDRTTREELNMRFQMVNPAEILLPQELSTDTERLLSHMEARLERLSAELFDVSSALTRVLACFVSHGLDAMETEQIIELPPLVLGCLAALQHHLIEFCLQKAIQPKRLYHLSSESSKLLHMNSSALKNLEVLVNTSGTTTGTLFWALNYCKTRFGSRLLRQWIIQPLRDLSLLEDRQNCISSLLQAGGTLINDLIVLLGSLPDLEKGLTTILHKKCSPALYLLMVESLCRLHNELLALLPGIKQEIKEPAFCELVSGATDLLSDIQPYMDNINIQAAKDGDKTNILLNFSSFPSVVKLMQEIEQTKKSLSDLRPTIARKLSLISFDYTSVSGQEYLVEIRNSNLKSVPADWRKVSCTKVVGRYRPPAVDKLVNDLKRLKEKLGVECNLAWLGLLENFSSNYFSHIRAIHFVAMIDVLLSLTRVAQQEGYCRPTLIKSEDAVLSIKRGVHPVLPLLFPNANQYVPNDTDLKSDGECCMILSGPNMGGKSCYIRQVALIALMAHIGSYVPAENAIISLLDSIHIRMGARDELFQGRSTLMVELDETATILKKLSKRSLVLLDELGRGTGSYDGSAIASATLNHLVAQVQCLTLFVTHYPSVMETANTLQGSARNFHMAFVVHDTEDGEVLTFLYEVAPGAADRSYGINAARLANIDRRLLHRAAEVASDLEKEFKRRQNIWRSFIDIWRKRTMLDNIRL